MIFERSVESILETIEGVFELVVTKGIVSEIESFRGSIGLNLVTDDFFLFILERTEELVTCRLVRLKYVNFVC